MRGRNRGITIYGTQKRISTMRVCTQTWAIAARDKLGVKTAISGGDRAARRPAGPPAAASVASRQGFAMHILRKFRFKGIYYHKNMQFIYNGIKLTDISNLVS